MIAAFVVGIEPRTPRNGSGSVDIKGVCLIYKQHNLRPNDRQAVHGLTLNFTFHDNNTDGAIRLDDNK